MKGLRTAARNPLPTISHLLVDNAAPYPSEGNQTPTITPGKVIFLLKTLPHERFTRNGLDLVYKAEIPLYDALVGNPVEVVCLDGR